ncbi:MAG: hypothetical protein HQK49_06580 [Oligoflexia bacterium]|nr:hypothetical protein [Oligoflexia bacterium]
MKTIKMKIANENLVLSNEDLLKVSGGTNVARLIAIRPGSMTSGIVSRPNHIDFPSRPTPTTRPSTPTHRPSGRHGRDR